MKSRTSQKTPTNTSLTPDGMAALAMDWDAWEWGYLGGVDARKLVIKQLVLMMIFIEI